ncbi:MAG: hypothetical protein M1822_002083 [Bathelium mastoideum]|nr:MAG: hypothetical protein M1822_002083 [Bathelium mastoideum]
MAGGWTNPSRLTIRDEPASRATVASSDPSTTSDGPHPNGTGDNLILRDENEMTTAPAKNGLLQLPNELKYMIFDHVRPYSTSDDQANGASRWICGWLSLARVCHALSDPYLDYLYGPPSSASTLASGVLPHIRSKKRTQGTELFHSHHQLPPLANNPPWMPEQPADLRRVLQKHIQDLVDIINDTHYLCRLKIENDCCDTNGSVGDESLNTLRNLTNPVNRLEFLGHVNDDFEEEMREKLLRK